MSAAIYASWVKTATATRFGITVKEITESKKSPTLVRARQIAMAVTKELFPFVSYPELGETFGARHHTTAWDACKHVAKKVQTDHTWRADFDAVKKMALEMMPKDRRPG